VRGTEQEARELADHIIVTTGGDRTSVEVIVGLIHTYRRDMLCLNNSIMDTIIICPEAVIIGRDLKFEWRLVYYIYVENILRRHAQRKRNSRLGSSVNTMTLSIQLRGQYRCSHITAVI
jgi:hypothetical protein